MAQFKGTIYETARLYTERHFGAEGVQRVLDTLSPQQRDALHGLSPVGWYPTPPIMAFHHGLDDVFGRGDLALCEKVGEFSAAWALNSVLKFYVRFRSPHWLLERNGSLWGRYHDTGRWEVLGNAPKDLQARLHDFAVRDPAFCARFRGWLKRAIELTGGREPEVIESQCVCRGAAYCEFQSRWR